MDSELKLENNVKARVTNTCTIGPRHRRINCTHVYGRWFFGGASLIHSVTHSGGMDAEQRHTVCVRAYVCE